MFSFDRSLKDTLNYALTMKNGNVEQKRAMNLLDQIESKLTNTELQNIHDTAKYIYPNNHSDLEELIDIVDSSATNILSALLSPEPLIYENTEEQFPHYKKKKKRKRRPTGL